MYQRILVAYNASKHSSIALREAVDIARASGGELHVLGIVPNTGALALAESAGTMDVIGMEHTRIREALETVADQITEQGLNVTTSIREGDPASEIIDAAIRISADLAVVGHSNKGVLARWFQGSVGAKLVSDLPCSLLIATEYPQAGR